MIGRTLGQFRIIGRLGEGGMGEVYRARDEHLARDVAVKVLPEAFAADPERLARFEREARVLASLNHPNIGAIFGLEETDSGRCLILELVEGETLAERIQRGALPLEKVLPVALQVTQGLEAAHERGVIHRDLKPANIKLTPDGTVKILDFGLAKACETRPDPGDFAESPTLSALATRAGVILGTAAYMSPEQARGRPLDKRTDIWSFGCLLFEMLSGKIAFAGDSLSDSIATVLRGEPDWHLLPAGLPAPIRVLLRRCLDKDAGRRLRDIGDARLEIADLLAAPHQGRALEVEGVPTGVASWRRLWLLGAVLLLGAALGASTLLWYPRARTYWKLPAAAPRQVVRQSGIVWQSALAPDGERFAYVLDGDLYLQALRGGEARRLTRDGSGKFLPRFSPDGRRLLYARYNPEGTGSHLYVLDLPDGIPRLLVEDASKGIWSPDGGRLAFVRHSSREAFVGDAGGSDPLSLGPARGFNWVLGLSWAPDGKSLAVVDGAKVFIVSADGKSRRQLPDVVAADALFTPDGRFLLVQMGRAGYWTIGQVPVAGGKPVPFSVMPFEANGMTLDREGGKLLVTFSKEEFHLAVARPAPEAVPDRFQRLTFGEVNAMPAVSPDETRIAYTGWGAIWVISTDGSNPRRVAAEGMTPMFPEWSPDGKTLVFGDAGDEQIWTVRLDEGTPRPFSPIDGKKRAASFMADGKHIVFALHYEENKSDLWLAPTQGGGATALTEDGLSLLPRAAPVDASVAYLQRIAPDQYEIRVLDTVTKQSRMVASAEALSRFGRFDRHAPRWSRDGRHLLLSTESGLLRVPAAGGSLEKFSFRLPRSFVWEDVASSFDLFSDRIVFTNTSSNIRPWLFSELE